MDPVTVVQEPSLGPYSVPLILTVVMAVVYKTFESIPDRWKSTITIIIGVLLSVIALVYEGDTFTAHNTIDHLLYGFMQGAAAVGLWEGFRSAAKPRQ